jgi:HlyD family secretion protein
MDGGSTGPGAGAPAGRMSAGRALARREREGALPAILEFQSPSSAVLTAPVPFWASGTIWIVFALFAAILAAMGTIAVDRVVTAQGKVISSVPNIMVQPLETAIVRAIHVREGQAVKAGELLAQLDPTFAAADLGALAAQVAGLQAEVSRMQAELDGRQFTYSGLDPALSLQAAIFAQRQAERNFRLETYRQKLSGLESTITRAVADAEAYRQRRGVAERVETMRRDLERMQVGSRLHSLTATDNRLEMERGLANAENTAETAKRDLAALMAERDAFEQNWRSETAQKLAEQIRKLSDARESLNKAQLRRQMVELRAEVDGTILTIARVSVGSVMQSGEAFITMVPADAPLEVEANIAGRDNGFVRAGDPVAIKFDTFPFTQYGIAHGRVRTVSADSFTAADEQRTRAGLVPLAPGSLEPFFRARISIDSLALHGVPGGFRLAPGMPVTADIKVGTRTVLGYLLGRALPVAAEGMREP